MSKTITILVTMLATTAIASADNDDDAEAAAKLLFGGGLLIEPQGDSVTISYDPKGTLNDARVRDLVERFLKPEVRNRGASPSFNAEFQLYLVDYSSPAKQGGSAWVMLEPMEKRNACINIAEEIRDSDRMAATLDWCRWEAGRTARHSLHDFKGQPVVGKAGEWNYHGELKFTTPMWKDDNLHLVVPGLERAIDIQGLRVQQNLLRYLPEENRYLAPAKRLMAKNEDWTKQRAAAVAALDKKQAGAKGRKVVFGRRWFGPWDPVEAVTSVDSCLQVYWKAFAAPKVKSGAVHVWQMAVDGTVCKTDFIQNHWIAVNGPFFTGSPDDCSPQLVTAGKHKLEVTLYATKDQKTGRVTFDSSDTSFREEIRSVTGKTVARGVMTCENATDLTIRAGN